MAIHIRALKSPGENTTDYSNSNASPAIRSTDEHQELIVHELYKEALRLQTIGENDKSEAALKELLSMEYINKVHTPTRGEGVDFDRSMLTYSIYKNFAFIVAKKRRSREVIEAIIEAVRIDPSDVTMWYDLGIHAKEINHITLARFAFERGLQCNVQHWPCLDNLITILFVLGDYQCCLTYIRRAFEIDSRYAKGITLLRRMLKEQPALSEYTSACLEFCDLETDCPTVEPADEAELLDEAMSASQKWVEACGPEFEELPEVSFPAV